MDTVLCDELLQEIFHRLPPPSSAAISLVSKRWLRLLRSSLTSLSLCIPTLTPTPSLSSFLSHHPHLSSLSLSTTTTITSTSSDHLLISVATHCPKLKHLRFLTGPVSPLPLLSFTHLVSLTITLSRPLSFYWLLHFLSLKHLSLLCTNTAVSSCTRTAGSSQFSERNNNHQSPQLETLSLTGIKAGDYGLSWLWKNCRAIKKLRFISCEGVGDNLSFSQSIKALKTLQEVELRTCRPIVDLVLLNLAENSISLTSLLVYDGSSKEGLLQFIQGSHCCLRKLDLRLPLDLDNNHLFAIAANLRFGGLLSLRLQSCCLVTGEGLKTVGLALGNNLEELALINCDVIEREAGLLTTLGQSLRKLKKLDLSHNDLLLDKEFMSMMASCDGLYELKLRGCCGLNDASLVSVYKNCRNLESVDMVQCSGIKAEGIELFVVNSLQLRRLEIEDYKLSDVARMWVENTFVCRGCNLIDNLAGQAN